MLALVATNSGQFSGFEWKKHTEVCNCRGVWKWMKMGRGSFFFVLFWFFNLDYSLCIWGLNKTWSWNEMQSGKREHEHWSKEEKTLALNPGLHSYAIPSFPSLSQHIFQWENGSAGGWGACGQAHSVCSSEAAELWAPGNSHLCWFCGALALPALSASRTLKPVSEDLTGWFDMFFSPCCGFGEDFVRTTAVPLYQHCNFLNQQPSMCFIVGFVVTTCRRNIVDHLQHSNKLDCIHHPVLGRTTEWKGHTKSYKCALFWSMSYRCFG